MLQDDEEHKKEVMENIFRVHSQDLLGPDHQTFLETLCKYCDYKFNVIFDIGSCVLHWHRHAHRIWPEADIYCFDAFSPLVELYEELNVNFDNVLLSDIDGLKIKFYQNYMFYGGNS